MAKGGDFIERENRTTVWAIIAIVVIVGIVAVFLRVSNVDWFSFPEKNVGGLATNTFEGVHYLSLQRHDILQGSTEIQGIGARTYYAFLQDQILYVRMGQSSYEAPFEESLTAPGIYETTYPEGAADVAVTLNTFTRTLWLQGLFPFDPEQALPIQVVPAVLYDGSLVVTGNTINAQYISGSDAVSLTVDGQQYLVPLEIDDDGMLSGTWNWDDADHLVIVNPDDLLIIFHDLY